MKKYMFRRIIAGAMALLTVAAYTPLTDFSVLQQSTAIVASARDAALTSQSLTTTAWELGDYFEANAEFNVPESSAGIDISFGDKTISGNENVEVFNGELNEKNAIVATAGSEINTSERVLRNVTAVEYVAAEKKMLITYNDSGEKYAVATIKDSTATKYFLAVTETTAAVAGTSNFKYTLGAKEIADSYTLDLADVAAYVDTFTFTNKDGVEKTLNADTVAAGTYTAKAKTLVTLKTTARLSSNMDAYLDKDATDTANALYVYTFMLLENKARNVFTPATGTVSIANAAGTDAAAFDANSTYTIKAAGVSDQTETGVSMAFNAFDAKAGQKVTMTSNVPFRIDTGAQKLVGTEYEAVYAYGVYADGKYTATFVNLVEETPRTGFTGGVKVEFIKHSHTLSYTTSANRLYASCTSEMKDLVDAEVAAIYATIPATEDQLKADPKTTEYEVANNGKIQFTEENADKPTLTLTVDDTLLGVANNNETQHYVATINDGTYTYTYTYDTAKVTDTAGAIAGTITPEITKYVNGKSVKASELTASKFNATARPGKTSSDGPLSLAKGITFANGAFAEGGTYDVSLEVYDQNNNGKKVISYTYTVTPSEAINENVLEVSGAYYNKTNPASMAYNLKATKNADGVYEIPVDEATVKSSGNVFVQFNFVKDKTKTDPAERYFSDQKFGFDGSDKGNVLDKVYTETITITDSSYTGGPFTVKWKLVKAKENDGLYYEFEGQNALINTKAGINETAKEVQYDAIEEQLKGFLKSSDETLDVSKATFQYTATAPVDGNDIDLDGMKDGLPVLTAAQMASASGVNKVFYVYASVGSVSTVNPIKIKLVEDATTSVHPVLNKLSYVYGERITLDDISFVTAAGTKVTFDKDDITNIANDKGDGKVNNEAIKFTMLDDKGKPITSGGVYTVVNSDESENSVYFLEPGKYQVEFNTANIINVSGNGKTTKGYTITADTSNDSAAVKYTIEVTKRTIEPSMFADYTADLSTTKQATITNTTYNSEMISLPVDGMKPLTVTVSGGTSKATKAGTYQVELTPTGDAVTKYYEGTASVNWYAKTTATAVPALVWNQKGQNIYKGEDGSIQVHVEAFQAKKSESSLPNVANGVYSGTDYAKDAAVTTASTVTTKFGFVYDKTQTFAKDADPAEVAKALKLDADGGFKGQKATNATKKGTNGIMTGLNFKVESADDYYWVRPYVTVEGGAPTYGKPMLVDFQTVAQEVLQPTLESVQLVQKDVNGKSGLYYYVYATKYTRVDGEDRTIQPERWGIVLDRTGNYGATVAADDFDYEALTLDNCDAHSEALKNATKYTEDEVGTLISIKDSLSRVYVRNYIDFGNGLVVYNEKPEHLTDDANGTDGSNQYADKYFTESASATLAQKIGLTTSGTPGVKMAASRKQKSTGATSDVVTIPARATLNTKANAKQVFEPIVIDNRDSDDAVAENKLTEFGLVVDRTGAAYNVYEEKYTDAVPANFFTLSDSYKVYKAADVNKDYLSDATATSLSLTKADVVAYTLSATAPANQTVFTYRAYAKYKGIDIYGDTRFVNDISTNDASEWGKG